MNKRQSDSVWIIVAVVCISVFMLWAAPARGIVVMKGPDGTPLYVWTEAEMDKLEAALERKNAEIESLKAKLAKGGCT